MLEKANLPSLILPGSDNPQFLHFGLERRALHPQAGGRACRAADDPVGFFQHAQDVAAFGVLERGEFRRRDEGFSSFQFGKGDFQFAAARQDHGAHLTARENGRTVVTRLGLVLIAVEGTDVIFALDSIPAILAITTDSFIVFTSNIFAILGLRSLFFLLADLVDRFRYLKIGLAAVLVFVGAKMAAIDVVKVPAPASLAVIALLLGISVGLSWRAARREEARRSPVPRPA